MSAKRYLVVARNVFSKELTFGPCDLTLPQATLVMWSGIRDALLEGKFFLEEVRTRTVLISEESSGAYGLYLVSAYEYNEGQIEIPLDGKAQMAFWMWRRKETTKDWTIRLGNHASVFAEADELDQLFSYAPDQDEKMMKIIASWSANYTQQWIGQDVAIELCEQLLRLA